MYKGKIFFGALDGRLIALDAADGSLAWEVYTVDTAKKYTITGAPRVVKGKVIIGNSGAEFGVRGYITAYDAESGKQAWRFYTVPGDPSTGFESKAMEMAAKTWNGEWWKYGGGGTCWDAMAYDPDLNLFYVGTGNGSPWNRRVRSPGGGDNLFLSSIVAINPDNGEYVWHYQTTPGEDWDYTATQPLVLADLEIEGAMRKVIMQAPKNGFFYVVDRTNGKFISAKPFTYVNWASGISPEGRPVENEFPMLASMNVQTFPGPDGAHSWHPMAFNLKNKLMYIPIHDISFPYGYDSTWKFGELKEYGSGNGYNTGRDIDPDKAMSPDPNAPEDMVGYLIAWDPVQQKQVWKFRQKHLWNGGVVTTAAGLVFQGAGDGVFRVFDGDDGKVLWETNVGTGAIAPPVTYMVDGIQYVSIPVGWGGSVVALWEKGTPEIYPARIFTFKLNGKAKMPQFYATEKPKPLEVNYPGTAAELKQGSKIYLQYCFPCHGPVDKNYGALPDLGHMQKVKFDLLDSIVLKGLLQPLGMPNFGDRLTTEQVDLIKKFIASSAKQISKD